MATPTGKADAYRHAAAAYWHRGERSLFMRSRRSASNLPRA